MKYYKLKTVAFYVFVATVISFDLKGSEEGGENENEGICPCCNCGDNKEKLEENKKGGEKEKKGGKKKKKKKKKKKRKFLF